MSFIKSIIAFLLTILIAAFCILNLGTIDVNWSPVHEAIKLPLYALILGAMLFGFIIGAGAQWLNSGKLRQTKRQQKKQIKTLEKELEKTSANTNTQNPPSDFFPALPKQSGS